MPISWLTSGGGLTEPKAVAHSEKVTYTDQSSPVGSVKLRCLWDEVDNICENILSNYHVWPYDSIIPLYAKSASWSPAPGRALRGGTGNGNTYTHAIIDLTYAWTDFGDGGAGDGDPVTETITPSGEMIKLKTTNAVGANLFFWGRNTGTEEVPVDLPPIEHFPATYAVSDDEAPNKLVIGFDYSLNFARFTGAFPAALLTMLDHVNDDDVTSSDSLGLTFPAETLLMTGTNIQQVFTGTSISKSLSINYSFRSHGWNRFWRPETGNWVRMYDVNDDIYYNFPRGDFSTITL